MARELVLLEETQAYPHTPTTCQTGRLQSYYRLDPGRRDLFTAVDQDDHFYRYSTAQYYEEAKVKQSNYKIANWYKRDEEVLDYVRNMPTKKTASLDTLVQYLNYLLPKLDVLLEWHMRPRMKNLKFKRFRFAQKALHSMCRKLVPVNNTIIGFGDRSNLDRGKLLKRVQQVPSKISKSS